MDELTIEGKLYISSKRAAKVSGYAKDYIGQLCREGRVDSKLVGRSWYVYEPSIREHRFNDERVKSKKRESHGAVATVQKESEPIDSVWSAPAYSAEPIEGLPLMDEKPPKEELPAHDEPQSLSQMQSAWQEWFAERKPETPKTGITTEPGSIRRQEADDEAYVPDPVPLRMIVSDIAPKREYTQETPYEAKETALHPRLTQKREEPPRHKGSLVAQSAFGALILIVVSVTLIATGVIEQIHLNGITDSPILRYFQGSTVVEK